MKIDLKHKLLIIGLTFALLFHGCKTRQYIPSEDYKKRPSDPGKIGKLAFQNNTKYDGLIIKNFKVKSTSEGHTTTLYASAKVIHDSLILASLRAPLGIEISRVLFSPDSIKIINRSDKKAILADYSYIEDFLHFKINFKVIESILSGNLPEGYNFNSNASNEIKDSLNNTNNKLYIGHYYNDADRDQIKFESWVYPDILKAKLLTFYFKRNLKLFDVQFNDYLKEESTYFPGEIEINHKNAYDIETQIRLIFSKFEKTENTTINFQIPSTYKILKIN